MMLGFKFDFRFFEPRKMRVITKRNKYARIIKSVLPKAQFDVIPKVLFRASEYLTFPKKERMNKERNAVFFAKRGSFL